MGCGGSEEKKSAAVVVEEKSEALLAIEAIVKKDPQGDWVWELYEGWAVDGDPVEVALKDGSKRKTWPNTWAETEKLLIDELKVDNKMAGHVKAETVDNDDLPHITEDCVTWPAIQRLIRKCWVSVNGPWVASAHSEEGAPYRGLLRANTLSKKREGLAKMLSEMGDEKLMNELWEVYIAWPAANGEETEVIRYNRKKALKGEMVDKEKKTWPLPFEGDSSVSSLLDAHDWSDDQIAALKTQLFDCKDESGVHPNCTEEQVCWGDLQQCFRATVQEDVWDADDDEEFPPLAAKVTLRLKIPVDQLKDILEGEYRMYCKPEGAGEPFSYGLIISDVDVEAGTFGGSSRKEGKYAVENGKTVHDGKTGKTMISYDELWANGQRDALTARVIQLQVPVREQGWIRAEGHE